MVLLYILYCKGNLIADCFRRILRSHNNYWWTVYRSSNGNIKERSWLETLIAIWMNSLFEAVPIMVHTNNKSKWEFSVPMKIMGEGLAFFHSGDAPWGSLLPPRRLLPPWNLVWNNRKIDITKRNLHNNRFCPPRKKFLEECIIDGTA